MLQLYSNNITVKKEDSVPDSSVCGVLIDQHSNLSCIKPCASEYPLPPGSIALFLPHCYTSSFPYKKFFKKTNWILIHPTTQHDISKMQIWGRVIFNCTHNQVLALDFYISSCRTRSLSYLWAFSILNLKFNHCLTTCSKD